MKQDFPYQYKECALGGNFSLVKWFGSICERVTFHLIILFFVSAYCLKLHTTWLFRTSVGVRVLMYANHQWHWSSHAFYQGMDLFAGMGNIAFGSYNHDIVFFIQNFFLGHVGILRSFIIYSLLLFFTVYFISRLFHFSKNISLVAAWIFLCVTLPYLSKSYLNNIYIDTPTRIGELFFCWSWIYAFYRVGRSSILVDVFCLLLLIFIPYYMVMTYLQSAILYAPVSIISACYFIFFSDSGHELRLKITVLIVSLGVLCLLGLPQFIYGLFSYTAFYFFTKEMYLPTTSLIAAASILFKGHISILFPLVVILSLFGGFYSFSFSRCPNIRKFSRLFITLALTVILLGLALNFIYMRFHIYGIKGAYFEYALYPLYIVYAVYGVYGLYQLLLSILRGVMTDFYDRDHFEASATMRLIRWREEFSSILIFIIPAYFVLFSHYQGSANRSYLRGYPFPKQYTPFPERNAIIKKISSQIALNHAGAIFRGYEATFAPKPIKGIGIQWDESYRSIRGGMDMMERVSQGNDYRLVGLYPFGIPTIANVSQLMTPPYYLLGSRLLSRPIDKQNRTTLVMTTPNVPMLEMMGVHYIVTNQPKSDFVSRSNYSRVLLKGMLPIDKKDGAVYLYELPEYNSGSFYPTRLIYFDNATQILNYVINKNINFRDQVIVSSELSYHLVKPRYSMLKAIVNGLAIKSYSRGVSSILIPIQYSHCLKASFSGAKPKVFAMQRANLIATLLVFSGKLNMKLNFIYGPFYNSDCRLKDFKDMVSLKLNAASHKFPLKG